MRSGTRSQCNSRSSDAKTEVAKLKKSILLGLDCFCVAYRCAVFYYKQSAVYDVGLEPVKLRRIEASPDSITCLFDHDTFVTALKDFLDDRGPKPDPYCVLVLGQKQPFCRGDSSVLVSVTVATSRALEDLRKAEEAMALRTPSVLESSSNEFDNLARYMQHYVEVTHQQQQHQQAAQAAINLIEVQYSPDNEPQNAGTDQSAVLQNPEDVL